MTGITEGATVPPPKKRSFFKKAAWQTEVKADPGTEEDMFSHSNEFRDIMNEEKKRRKRDKQLREEKRKVKPREHDKKRRKVSSDYEDSATNKSGSGNSPGPSSATIRARNRTSPSPSLSSKVCAPSLGSTDDTLLKSSASARSDIMLAMVPNVIDLSDSDLDDDRVSYQLAAAQLPLLAPKPVLADNDDIEEVEDPFLAELAAKARARAANSLKATNTLSGASPALEHDPIVQLFITSDIEDSKPLLARVRCSSTVSRPRESWCKMQGFSPEMTREVFLTWKNKKIFDSTTIKRLGITIDANGIVTVEGDSDIYTDDNLPKIHIEAWTDDLFRQKQREQAEAVAAKNRTVEEESRNAGAELEPKQEPELEKKKRYRLFLKAKGRSEWKISVNRDTTFEHLTSAYKEDNRIPEDQPVTLLFDGERLRPMDTIGDTEIDDLDAIEVHFK